MILEQTDCEGTYVHQPSHLITGKYYVAERLTPCAYNFALFRSNILLCLHDADSHPISFLYTVDSLPALSNLTKELASMQRDKEEKRPQNVPHHPLSDITNAYQPSSMDLDKKRDDKGSEASCLSKEKRGGYRQATR